MVIGLPLTFEDCLVTKNIGENMMYKVYIRGIFRTHCKTIEDAMAYVDKWASPFKHDWQIRDISGKVCMQG
jgi:hypothetical protein